MVALPRGSSLEEEIARDIVAPLILRLLKPFKAEDMNKAITEDVKLDKALREDPEYLSYLRNIVAPFPFTDEAAKRMKRKSWVKWFLENEMRHSRPDLYAQIVYHPDGFKYILKEIRKLVNLIFR